ncbi:condensation domain-containing protein, partial [Pseudomonas sp. NPDC012596]|uniref:condensation domain-containing protein n=1 Tax=Pseudomonas sp. NPDC012596 TaxID=3364419 RepID=UPI00367A79EA
MLKQGGARPEQLVARIRALSGDKRRQLFARLRDMGVNVAHLPIVPAQDSGPAPLSYAQQRQHFLWQLDPQGCAYNIPVALRLRGALDIDALRQALEALVERQASLRTRFVEAQGEVYQVVDDASGAVPLSIDTSPVFAHLRDRHIQTLVETELRTPFDLANEPLWRVRLVGLAEDDFVLLMTLHHAISDGWSMGVVVDELLACYSAAAQGQATGLAALSIQYHDYARWQREWMESGELQRQLDYWTTTLGELPPVLALPTDHPRPQHQSLRGARLALPLPPMLSEALHALAQRQGATVFMLLLASFAVVLQRCSGQHDLRIGVPNANRNRSETERLVGLFVNTQVLRLQVDDSLPFAQWLHQVEQTVNDAQAHSELPFEQLVEALQPERSLGHNPLFQVMHNHQVSKGQTLKASLGGLQIEGLPLEAQTAQLDLTLETQDTPDGLCASLVYATDLFKPQTVANLGRHWLNLLQSIVCAPETRIGELPMLDNDERVLLEQFNATTTPYDLTQTVHGLFEQQVQANPDAPALLFGEQQLSYAELNARANRLAHRLIAAGVGEDVLVGVAAERSLELVVGLLAVLKAGGAYVPLDPDYPAERLAYLFEDSGVSLLLTQPHLA